jgi:hypothetical protein
VVGAKDGTFLAPLPPRVELATSCHSNSVCSSRDSRIEAIACVKLGGGGGFPFPWEFSAPFHTLRVFTILSSKHVTISLEIKLNTKANLSNGKGDNSITTENPVNSVRTIQSIQFLSFCALMDRIRSGHKQDNRREVSMLSNSYLHSLIRKRFKSYEFLNISQAVVSTC